MLYKVPASSITLKYVIEEEVNADDRSHIQMNPRKQMNDKAYGWYRGNGLEKWLRT